MKKARCVSGKPTSPSAAWPSARTQCESVSSAPAKSRSCGSRRLPGEWLRRLRDRAGSPPVKSNIPGVNTTLLLARIESRLEGDCVSLGQAELATLLAHPLHNHGQG